MKFQILGATLGLKLTRRSSVAGVTGARARTRLLPASISSAVHIYYLFHSHY